MSWDCIIEQTARKDKHIADALSRMEKYPGVSTTKDDLIPHIIAFINIRPLQEITSNHINLSDQSATSSHISKYPFYNMPGCRDINFTNVNCEVNKCKSRAEIAEHHDGCRYLNEEDMQLNSADNHKIIQMENKWMSLDEDTRSPILE